MYGNIYLHQPRPHETIGDFSVSASPMLDTEKPLGYMFKETLDHLGLQNEIVREPEDLPRLYIEGSVDRMRECLPHLRRRMGWIARRSAERGPTTNRRYAMKTADRVLQRVEQIVPDLPDEASLLCATGAILEPFAKVHAADNTSVRVHYGRQAPWRVRNDSVKAEDGSPLKPFEVRDIGGLEVGADGLPARERYSLMLQLDHQDFRSLYILATALGTSIQDQLRAALDESISQPTSSRVQPVSVGHETQNVAVNLPREGLERATMADFGNDATLGDLLRMGVKQHIARHFADPAVRRTILQLQQSGDI